MEEIEVQVKVVILGKPDVGKSSILRRYITGECNESIENTIGAKFMGKIVTIDDKTVKLNIWDTAGQERYQSFSKLYCRDAGAVILVYDVNEHESFEGMKQWYEMSKEVLPEQALLFVVGNKCDKLAAGLEFESEVLQYTDGIRADHFLVSAKTGLRIDELFVHISRKYIENITFEKRSSFYVRDLTKEKIKKKKKFC